MRERSRPLVQLTQSIGDPVSIVNDLGAISLLKSAERRCERPAVAPRGALKWSMQTLICNK